jgi:hypothetical protein
MNKKLLFGIMSLAALAACTNDDFESKNVVAETTSPIKFEVLNDNAAMRAAMGGDTGDKVVWSATAGDLFTLYHGGTCAASGDPLTAYENATYKAVTDENGQAILTTPSMIKPGYAIMTWPTDTVFRANGAALSIVIPQNQGGKDEKGNDIIQNQIPYVSDLINIQTYAAYNEDATKGAVTAYNTAGKDRKYSVYMRPMASQLNLKADYGDTEKTIAELYEGGADGLTGEDAIDPIEVTSVELLTTAGTNYFTTEIPLTFAAQTLPLARWTTADANNAWSHVTQFGTPAVSVDKLTTKHLLDDNKGCKFLILPQAAIAATGVPDGAVVVNTIYGKVVIADPDNGNPHATKYTTAEYQNAWYRYLSTRKTAADAMEKASATTAETSGDNVNKYKTVALNLQLGMKQTIDYMSTYVAKASLPAVETEPIGVALTRYVNVNLAHLDMSDLHITSDQQLRNAAKVWKKMGLDGVVVYLDGDDNNEFKISQKTINVINTINTGKAVADQFHVKPCGVATHKACNTIVITGGGNVPADLTFIEKNGTQIADVAFNAGEEWKWNGTVKTNGGATHAPINSFINRGTMKNDADATLKVTNFTGGVQKFVIPFENAEGAIWNITAGTLRVQFNVTNNGTVNISKGAQYRQDGQSVAAKKTTFTNEATTLPERITGVAEKIGKVYNEGVFATVGGGAINNYGLIEHADKDAMTFITANQSLNANGFTADAKFTSQFNSATSGAGNKMGQINLPYTNKDEDNISISAAAAQGFVSVTVNGGDELDEDEVGTFVNYIIVKHGVKTISELPAQIKYVEFNQPASEPRIEWNLKNTTVAPVKTAQYDGLIVKSDVNIKLGTTIAAGVTYLGADMYVAGVFNKAALTTPTNTIDAAATNWAGYFGNTTSAVATKYITFGE